MPTTTTKPVLLESGDRLTRAEFHERYCGRPDIKKAELVLGVVYVASPVSAFHGEPHADAMGWLSAYKVRNPGLRLADNATVMLDENTEVQPDASLWRQSVDGAHVTNRGYIQGPPQLVVEVAASSASYDLHDKKEAYRRNGVREYVVWRVLDEAIDWFRLVNGDYVSIPADASGVIESTAFPGLRLHVAKMLVGDMAGVLAALG